MASKRRIRRKSCTGKKRYLSIEEAQIQIGVIKRTTGDKSRFNHYHCKFCNGIHIGHAKGSNKIFMTR